jgi:hypothetical protein
LLYVVGLSSRDYVGTFRRTKVFSLSDYDLLLALLAEAAGLIVTPNTVTEVSNLLDRIGDPQKVAEINLTLRTLLGALGERYVASIETFARDECNALGVTDSVLLILASSNAVLITADFDLYQAAVRAGYAVVNFNHYHANNP